MASFVFTMPFALAENEAEILLVQRRLIQTRSGGRTVKGSIPDWAGQWGLVGDVQNKGEGAEATAIRAFREQCGLDLGDKDTKNNFLLQNQALVSLETENYTPFSVLCVFTTKAALDLVQSVVLDALGTEQVQDGTLSDAKVMSVAAARQMLGPRKPPPNGWQSYLLQNYFGGKPPGPFNTEIDELTKIITSRAAQDCSFFETALDDKVPN